MGLNRERVVQATKDAAFLKAMAGDAEGAYEGFKDYINKLFPSLNRVKTDRAKEMYEYYNKMKDQKMHVAVDERSDVIKLKIG